MSSHWEGRRRERNEREGMVEKKLHEVKGKEMEGKIRKENGREGRLKRN